jgi:hypothetical protein
VLPRKFAHSGDVLSAGAKALFKLFARKRRGGRGALFESANEMRELVLRLPPHNHAYLYPLVGICPADAIRARQYGSLAARERMSCHMTQLLIFLPVKGAG